MYKRHLSEIRSNFKPISTWIETSTKSIYEITDESIISGVESLQTGLNQTGTKEFGILFEEKVFDYPKPVGLIKTLIKQSTKGTEDETNYILDFFAGSGTTAQSVLELNTEDQGNRQFILVQIPEPTSEKNPAREAGYSTISQITRERVRRVIQQLNAQDEGKLPLQANEDRGFRAFTLTASNFKGWDSVNAPRDTEGLTQALSQMAMNLNPDATEQSILFEILLKTGLPLSASIEALTLEAQTVYAVSDKRLYICLANPVSEATLRAIIPHHPQQVVCLDVAFAGNDQLKTNIALQMKNAQPEIQFWTI